MTQGGSGRYCIVRLVGFWPFGKLSDNTELRNEKGYDASDFRRIAPRHCSALQKIAVLTKRPAVI
jgi:hypothetical protein